MLFNDVPFEVEDPNIYIARSPIELGKIDCIADWVRTVEPQPPEW